LNISFVIPVYNEASSIERSLESVLAQREVEFEVILVNDGSSDESGRILDAYAAKSSAINVIHQDNLGITRSLINACNLAKGDYIARQDIGDLSKASRLARQLDSIESSDAVLCSSGTQFFSEAGELLFEVNDDANSAQIGLNPTNFESMRGPSHHGATLFLRSAYEAVGGYRENFQVAQDLDLWLRLAKIGTHITTETVEYLATIRRSSISTKKRALQEATRKIIFNCYQARQAGVDDATLLDQLKRLNTQQDESQAKSDYDYFVGSMLYLKRDKAALPYLQSALRSRPYAVKAWLKLLHLRLFGS